MGRDAGGVWCYIPSNFIKRELRPPYIIEFQQWKRIRNPLEPLWSLWKPSDPLWKPSGNPLFHGLLPGREWGFFHSARRIRGRSGVAVGPKRYQAEVHHTIKQRRVSQRAAITRQTDPPRNNFRAHPPQLEPAGAPQEVATRARQAPGRRTAAIPGAKLEL